MPLCRLLVKAPKASLHALVRFPILVQLLSNDIATGPINLGRRELQPVRPQSIIFDILSGTIYAPGC
jgi:hypothetical protein